MSDLPLRSFRLLVTDVFRTPTRLADEYFKGNREDIAVFVVQLTSAHVVGYDSIEEVAGDILRGQAFRYFLGDFGRAVTSFAEISNEEARSFNRE
jgi:hypothetical protein